MFVGPVFTREAVTSPRRTRFYIARSSYILALLVLMSTAWGLLTAEQPIRTYGDLANFGSEMFQLLAPLQLLVTFVAAAIFTASSVAQEKDRRTLVLLLMTRMNNSELVLGKLLASVLIVFVMLAAAIPVFLFLTLLGGISLPQIGYVFAVTFLSAFGAGSIGSTYGYWREKTFQAVALTAMTLLAWIVVGELFYLGVFGTEILGYSAKTWGYSISPFRAIEAASTAVIYLPATLNGYHPVIGFLIFVPIIALVFNGISVFRVRAWNIASAHRTAPEEVEGDESINTKQPTSLSDKTKKYRKVWDYPIAWKEICTWTYGRKILFIKFAYLCLTFLAGWFLYHSANEETLTHNLSMVVVTPIFVISMILVNAMSVTSFCIERDSKALDLLLVTEITPAELTYSKLIGVFYNAKEMIIAPIVICSILYFMFSESGRRFISGEDLLYVSLGYLVMIIFVTMLGQHSGMSYNNSRMAIGTSLGTVFFLFLGVATCMRLIAAFSGELQFQLVQFFALLLGGGIGLFFTLGYKNPSRAIGMASFLCPFFTFYAITGFLQDFNLSVFIVITFTYGLATLSMLIPAISGFEFIALSGRSDENDDPGMMV